MFLILCKYTGILLLEFDMVLPSTTQCLSLPLEAEKSIVGVTKDIF
jgi:hypothetical protein